MSGQLHKDLVLAAAAWLKKNRCVVVITDMVTAASETPDALGWEPHGSILIECKASRSDFRADALKPFRRPGVGMGMGNRRFYMAPEGVITPELLPTGWGLLEVNDKGKVRKTVPALMQQTNHHREILLLISAMRRIGQTPPEGISVRCYTLDTKRTATVGILPFPQPEPLPKE